MVIYWCPSSSGLLPEAWECHCTLLDRDRVVVRPKGARPSPSTYFHSVFSTPGCSFTLMVPSFGIATCIYTTAMPASSTLLLCDVLSRRPFCTAWSWATVVDLYRCCTKKVIMIPIPSLRDNDLAHLDSTHAVQYHGHLLLSVDSFLSFSIFRQSWLPLPLLPLSIPVNHSTTPLIMCFLTIITCELKAVVMK